MLTTLRIKNLALVSDLSLELPPGFNVITGETGAGKSILIGALNLVLGERADRTLIRSGCDSCSVEAAFQVAKLGKRLNQFLEENGLEPCDDDQLLLRRAFSNNGTNRQFINGSPATLQVLKTLGEWLVDIHGPHDHQSLLHPHRQLEILDAFGGLHLAREAYVTLLARRGALDAEKRELIVDEKTFVQQMDLLRFQASEIEAARLEETDEATLVEEHERATNSARLLRLCQEALGVLNENEPALLQQAAQLGRTLQELQKIDPGASPLARLHEEASTQIQELQHQLASYADRLEIDPLRYQELEDRLNLIQGLKRKYGATLAEIQAFGTQARAKLRTLEQRDAELLRLNIALDEVESALAQAGQELSRQRQKALPKLGKAAAKQLSDLGFRQSHFDVSVSTVRWQPGSGSPPPASGLDTIEFQFAPNPGEAPRPLRAIASSGELARVMLALKTVLATEDAVPVLVFDEVDANVGGETARTIGQKMSEIAKQHQVICITHLAPVAAPAQAHFVVSKQTQAGRTTTRLESLRGPERVKELARMLGGQSDAARKHAEELLAE